MQMKQPGNLRARLNHYGHIPQMAEQTKELTRNKLTGPKLACSPSPMMKDGIAPSYN